MLLSSRFVWSTKMAWFNKAPAFLSSLAQKVGLYTPTPEKICEWDNLSCHFEKLNPVFKLCESNACLIKNLFNYASQYDAGVVAREFSKNYLPYIVGTAVAGGAVIVGVRYCLKRRRKP